MGNWKGGRPHKGDRFAITVRVPSAYRGKLTEWVNITGETQSDLAARLLMQYLDTHDPTQAAGQEDLLAQTKLHS